MMLVCAECKTETRQGYQFCGQCGSELLTKICPECKSEMPRTAHKCPHCREDQFTLRNALAGLALLTGLGSLVWWFLR